jgi:hypothetical protein
MKAIAIYVEGGGSGPNTSTQQAELRTGFDGLLSAQKEAARAKRLGWKLVPCGGRDQTYDMFRNSVAQTDDETLVILLVDSEGPVSRSSSDGEDARLRVEYLLRREKKWDLQGVRPTHVHLMVQCMEAWIVADQEVLASFYGQGFNAKSLPSRQILEDEPKDELQAKLRDATRRSRHKGEYAKIKHASKLLQQVDPARVVKRCPRFGFLTQFLMKSISEA